MFTLFTVPKAFAGHIGVIQRNALRSWASLHPDCEILVFADETGAAEAAREVGAEHVPVVERNERGTPLVSNLFAQVERRARHRVLVYANADMILLDDLVRAVDRVRHLPRFLLCGRRWNLQVNDSLVLDREWQPRLREAVARDGRQSIPGAIDYFVFPRGMYGPVPPFAIGRAEWDQWMLYRARALAAPLIDATPCVLAIHQNHDYRHLTLAPREEVQREIDRNRALALFHRLDLRDATHLLTPAGLRRALDLPHLRRRLFSLPKFYLPRHPAVCALYGFWRRRIRGIAPVPG